MKTPLLYTLLCLSFLITSCDDPTTNQQPSDGASLPSITDDLIRISSIEIKDNNTNQVLQTYLNTYNEEGLLAQTEVTGLDPRLVLYTYTNNRRLLTILGTGTEKQLNYPDDQVRLSYLEQTDTIVHTYNTDIRNRIDRILKTTIDTAGTSSVDEDISFTYTENNNVSRLTRLDGQGNTMSYTLFQYQFNNNPFKDTNEIIGHEIFHTFIPYTRFLPIREQTYQRTNGQDQLIEEHNYDYTLNTAGLPTQRIRTTTVRGQTQIYTERYTYQNP